MKMMMNSWIYNNTIFTIDENDSLYGFVYCITNLLNNKKYIGRKYLTRAKTKQVKGKKKKIRVDSNWQNYWGSNKILLEDIEKYGKDNFKREIIHLCKSRGECSYMESKEIFMRDALLKDDYYNQWCSCKIQRNHLKTLLTS
jgi:hypothetical protein